MKRAHLFDGPSPRQKLEPELVLSFRLNDAGRGYERPIAEVFNEAMEILGGTSGRLRANWLATVAVRAVCEAVIRAKCLPMPLAVDLRFERAEDDVALDDDGIAELRRNFGWTDATIGKEAR